MWEIAESKKPYNEVLSNEEVMKGVCKGTLELLKPTNPQVTEELWSLFHGCMSVNPSKRPTFQVCFANL